MKKLIGFLTFLFVCMNAGSAPVQGEYVPGVYLNIKVDPDGRLYTVPLAGYASETTMNSANNYLALIESKLPSLSAGRIPVEILTPVPINGNVGIVGTVGVSGSVSATIIGTPAVTATLAGTPTVSISGTVPISYTPTVNSFRNITGNASTQIKSGAGRLVGIVIGTGGVTAGATLYDNTSCSGTKISTVNTGSGQNQLTFEVDFTVGLCITTTGLTPADLTITYR